MEKKVYVMLDTETTGLDPSKALAWQVGMIAFTSDYEKLSSFEVTSGIEPREWDQETLKWAAMQYPKEVFEGATVLGSYSYKHAMLDVQDWLSFIVSEYGIKNVVLICNHVEFDWPILLNSFVAAGIDRKAASQLIYYRNKLDLQSLCIGKVGAAHDTIYRLLPSSSEVVTHRALEDCYRQIEMLKHFGVELPG